MNFLQAIDAYEKNYVKYRVTGRSEHKVAYESAQQWIETYLANLNKRIVNNSVEISKFVNESSLTNPELTKLQAQFSSIRKDGPALEDTYATVKRVNAEQPVLDHTDLYVKAGIAAGLLGIVIALSL